MKRRVVVTGIGMIGDFGTGQRDFCSFISGSRRKKNIHDFHFDDYINTSLLRRADEVSYFASTAAKFALEDANLLNVHALERDKVGIVLGTTHGSLRYSAEYHKALVIDGPRMVSPLLFSNSVLTVAVGHISTMFGIRGYTTTISGYTPVLQSVKRAVELICEGNIDICLVGGVDIYDEIIREAYSGCMEDSVCVADRFGGSGFLVLESHESAQSRRIRGYVEIVGTEILYANYTKVIKQDISPLRRLLDKVNLEPKKLDCILTASFNERDSRKREEFFLKGIVAKNLSVVDCKELFGYTFAAAEAFQIIFGVLKVKGEVDLGDKSFYNLLINKTSKLSAGCMLINKRSA